MVKLAAVLWGLNRKALASTVITSDIESSLMLQKSTQGLFPQEVISDLVRIIGYRFSTGSLEAMFYKAGLADFRRRPFESLESYMLRQFIVLNSDPQKHTIFKKILRERLEEMQGEYWKERREKLERILKKHSLDVP